MTLYLLTFDRTMSDRMESFVDRAVKAIDSDAFCHGGHATCAAHIGYEDSEIDQATRAAVIAAAKAAKSEYLRRHR